MFTFTVPGRPIPKGRPRLGKGHTFTPNATRAYEVEVRVCALNAMPVDARSVPLYETGAIGVQIDLYTAQGDIDNLCKSILDALNGAAWNDDSQVVELIAHKHPCKRADQRAVVSVWLIADL